MTAELKEIYSLDVECPLENFVPEQHDFFELTVRAMIGPVGEAGSESFQIQVCTPKWLQARCDGARLSADDIRSSLVSSTLPKYAHTLRHCSEGAPEATGRKSRRS